MPFLKAILGVLGLTNLGLSIQLFPRALREFARGFLLRGGASALENLGPKPR